MIKEEPGLTREMVKHLGQIEEMVLEQLAWKSGSPLFDAIDAGKVPTYDEVCTYVCGIVRICMSSLCTVLHYDTVLRDDLQYWRNVH